MTTEEVVRTAIELKCKLLKLNPDRMTLKVVELGTTHVLSTVELHVDYRDSYQAHDGTVMVAEDLMSFELGRNISVTPFHRGGKPEGKV